jgi:hypothetical protein
VLGFDVVRAALACLGLELAELNPVAGGSNEEVLNPAAA